jgi:hypothetical protein
VFTDFFSRIFADIGLWFFLFLAISFLIGGLSAWWARALPIARLTAEVRRLGAENKRLGTEAERAVAAESLAKNELVSLRLELDDRRLELAHASERLAAASAELEELRRIVPVPVHVPEEPMASPSEMEEAYPDEVVYIDAHALSSADPRAALPDTEKVDFLRNPLVGTDPFEEALLKARAAARRAHFYAQVPTDFLEEDPRSVQSSLEQDFLAIDPPKNARSGSSHAEIPVEVRAELEQAFALASLALEKITDN